MCLKDRLAVITGAGGGLPTIHGNYVIVFIYDITRQGGDDIIRYTSQASRYSAPGICVPGSSHTSLFRPYFILDQSN